MRSDGTRSVKAEQGLPIQRCTIQDFTPIFLAYCEASSRIYKSKSIEDYIDTFYHSHALADLAESGDNQRLEPDLADLSKSGIAWPSCRAVTMPWHFGWVTLALLLWPVWLASHKPMHSHCNEYKVCVQLEAFKVRSLEGRSAAAAHKTGCGEAHWAEMKRHKGAPQNVHLDVYTLPGQGFLPSTNVSKALWALSCDGRCW